jgi:hypothetical protein
MVGHLTGDQPVVNYYPTKSPETQLSDGYNTHQHADLDAKLQIA